MTAHHTLHGGDQQYLLFHPVPSHPVLSHPMSLATLHPSPFGPHLVPMSCQASPCHLIPSPSLHPFFPSPSSSYVHSHHVPFLSSSTFQSHPHPISTPTPFPSIPILSLLPSLLPPHLTFVHISIPTHPILHPYPMLILVSPHPVPFPSSSHFHSHSMHTPSQFHPNPISIPRVSIPISLSGVPPWLPSSPGKQAHCPMFHPWLGVPSPGCPWLSPALTAGAAGAAPARLALAQLGSDTAAVDTLLAAVSWGDMTKQRVALGSSGDTLQWDTARGSPRPLAPLTDTGVPALVVALAALVAPPIVGADGLAVLGAVHDPVPPGGQ